MDHFSQAAESDNLANLHLVTASCYKREGYLELQRALRGVGASGILPLLNRLLQLNHDDLSLAHANPVSGRVILPSVYTRAEFDAMKEQLRQYAERDENEDSRRLRRELEEARRERDDLKRQVDVLPRPTGYARLPLQVT